MQRHYRTLTPPRRSIITPPFTAKVEHPFLYIKRHFGYAKVRYRGLSKNTQRLMTLLGFANLMRAEQYLAA